MGGTWKVTCRTVPLFVLAFFTLEVVSSDPPLNTCRSREECQEEDHDRTEFMQKDMTLRSSQVIGGSDRLKIQSLGFAGHSIETAVNQARMTKKRAKEDTTSTSTTLPPDGVTLNAEGDLEAFITATITNTIVCIVLIFVFSYLRRRYPIMYLTNQQKEWSCHEVDFREWKGNRDSETEPAFWGWYAQIKDLPATNFFTVVNESRGLDCALMMKFCDICMEILFIIGLPMICIMGPMHWIFGECADRPENVVACHGGSDHMSYLSFGNVRNGSWLYYIHGFIVWGVVLIVQNKVKHAMHDFLDLRKKWLQGMADVRANTVLVEDIPDEDRSNQRLKEKFEAMLNTTDVEARTVKDTSTSELLASYEKRQNAIDQLKQAKGKYENMKEPRVRPTVGWGKNDLFDQLTKDIKDATEKIEDGRKHIKGETEKPPEKAMASSESQKHPLNLSSGFVTFTSSQQAQMALHLSGAITEDSEAWTIMTPPAPEDVLWKDLTQDETANFGRTLLGWGLVIGLGFAYMPMVIGMTNIANAISLCEGALSPFCMFESIWRGLAPTLGLQVMVAFLPTFIIWIFKLCFTLRAAQWAQHKLQIWYFWFQMVFVILVTAVGQDFTGFVQVLSTEPFSIFMKLADTMPYATHFYMNFLVLQWVTHVLNMTRWVQLMKFHMFSRIFEEKEAKEMAEPEDQDYYGMGARTARWSIMMIIALVFGTLSPPMNLLAYMNFVICRVVYGYLLALAETQKTDLGGVFFVTQMEHMFWGIIVYCVLMTGVLYQRSYSEALTVVSPTGEEVTAPAERMICAFPAVCAASALVYSYNALRKFRLQYSWEHLPMETLISPDKTIQKRTNDNKYVQPELFDDTEEEKKEIRELLAAVAK